MSEVMPEARHCEARRQRRVVLGRHIPSVAASTSGSPVGENGCHGCFGKLSGFETRPPHPRHPLLLARGDEHAIFDKSGRRVPTRAADAYGGGSDGVSPPRMFHATLGRKGNGSHGNYSVCKSAVRTARVPSACTRRC
jgi:hypothetical protein